uniref:Uncharacterized protein n=1 Tax=Arundo donax TaxID=35708 RepID=A0A0A9EYU3_ARUDO
MLHLLFFYMYICRVISFLGDGILL